MLGAWTTGDPPPEHIESLIDRAAGTWTGPNVTALHGGPAPFQDAADPDAWVDGERDPLASQFDFNHSGVCISLMAYCRHGGPRPVILPNAIDFAFLADIGLTVTEETTRPETYGLFGWADYAGFSLSVSRDLRFDLPERGGRNDRRVRLDGALDITDRLQVEVDTFGTPSVGDLLRSFPARDLRGTVRYAGGLLGAAIDRTGLPPVIGSSNLAVNLSTLEGTASFTSLAVHADGMPETFAGGSLHYPFTLSANAIIGTGTESTLRAGFHGPRHGNVAGTLHDPVVGLLASFGATHDHRPGREDVVASADYLLGSAYGGAAAGVVGAGWSQYRCGAEVGCVSRHADSGGWSDWAATTRSAVLGATARWSSRSTERPHADHDFVRISRQSDAFTRGLLGHRFVESHAGVLEHVAFGGGFERSAGGSTLSDGAFPETGGLLDGWARSPGDPRGCPARRVGKLVRAHAGIPGGSSRRRDAVGGGAREHRVLCSGPPVGRGFLRSREPGR